MGNEFWGMMKFPVASVKIRDLRVMLSAGGF